MTHKRFRYDYVIVLLCLISSTMLLPLNAVILPVAMDGSQQYTSIQSAVQSSAHGDTVLVYPGTYMENVNYSGKNITIASLELTTGDPSYRQTTIIDGNHNGATVRSIDPISNAGLFGFTIINGSGVDMIYGGATYTRGGGIYVNYASSFQLNSCIINDNYASLSGGGVYVRNGTIFMSDCLITRNSSGSGGGICIEYYGTIVFDQIQRSSVFENTAAFCQDIGIFSPRIDCSIYLDTATVNPPSDYYIYFNKGNAITPGNLLVLDVINGYRTEINSDLFVSPLGSNNNDGLSPDSPLKTIIRAVQLIETDSLNSRTIHLAPGIYSSSDEQFFPIGLKSYLSLVGDSLSMSVLENIHYPVTVNITFLTDASLSNVIIEHNNYIPAKVIEINFSFNTILKNITINPCEAVSFGGIDCGSNNYIPSTCYMENVQILGQRSNRRVGINFNVVDATLKNVTIDGCYNYGYEIYNSWPILYSNGSILNIENVSIINNSILNSNYSIVSIGMWIDALQTKLSITDLLFANNSTAGDFAFELYNYHSERGQISNCTFANNTVPNPYSPVLLNGNLQVANCIFYNDTVAYGEISMYNLTNPELFHDMLFQNNLIRNYPESVHYSNGQFLFNEFNFSANPSFCSDDWSDILSYRLGNSSPCIDTGMADTLGLNLPATDLYGNPRVYGNYIDIGCNEYSGYISNPDIPIPGEISFKCYPSPFQSSVTILIDLLKTSKTLLSIYNIKGQCVKTLSNNVLEKGEHTLIWDGTDEQNRKVGSGVYLVRLCALNQTTSIKKIIKVD